MGIKVLKEYYVEEYKENDLIAVCILKNGLLNFNTFNRFMCESYNDPDYEYGDGYGSKCIYNISSSNMPDNIKQIMALSALQANKESVEGQVYDFKILHRGIEIDKFGEFSDFLNEDLSDVIGTDEDLGYFTYLNNHNHKELLKYSRKVGVEPNQLMNVWISDKLNSQDHHA